jgi:hypothetical protein
MQHPRLWLSLLALLCVRPALAQQPGSAVQLPTFSNFSVGTTVSVPDRGSAYMGGINRSASGSSSFRSPLLPFRPFKNSAIGSQHSAMGVHVSAWIHDFEAMDEYLLSQPPRSLQPGAGHWNAATTVGRGPASLDPAWDVGNSGSTEIVGTRHSGGQWHSTPQSLPATPLADVADEQRRREVQGETRSREAQAFFTRGQEAEASGKANVARIYYQMVARRATGDLQTAALARLRAIGQRETGESLVRSSE